ncbi:MAG: DNA polymerase III subunit alpha, partial [Bacteroidota bacterium]
KGAHDDAFDQIELLGFPLCSPFDLVQTPTNQGILARDLQAQVGKQIQIFGYYVCRKDVTTSRRQHMYFGCWLDKEGHWFDTTHFPNSLHQAPFRGKGCYRIRGKVVLDFGFPSIEVSDMERMIFLEDERY